MRFRRPEGVNGLRRKDEHRIAGRVRLMLGDVEVADAEREIDRVEILERGGKKRQVQRDEREREQARREAEERSSTRRPA